MGIVNVASTLAELPTLAKLSKLTKPRPLDTCDSLANRAEQVAAQFADRPAIIFEGKTVSWRELNALANRYANTLKAQGLSKGDAVSLLMENRVEFVAMLIAVNKIGVAAALINTNLTGRSLVHCVDITQSRKCIFGEERSQAIADIRNELSLEAPTDYYFVADTGAQPCPDWAQDFGGMAQSADADNPPETTQITLGDTALYIFTSGTTGLPKAAVLSNRRYLLSAMLSKSGGIRCNENDVIYICLPLYHGTGLFLGAGAAFCSGACMFIRRKFSASRFLSEVREHGATCFIYIGELCRYLMAVPSQPDDHRNPLTRIMGNGLRPDVWHEFKNRFGIKRVSEFYGASEGNVAFVNLMNKDCTVGFTAMPVVLVKYDVENDEIVRDSNGFCIEVPKGEPGLMLAKITEDTAFEGYTSEEESEKKVLRNALEQGDAWFNSGDLMRVVDVGFTAGFPHYQFVDRVGDTFRWKSENVSTNEVGELLNEFDQVHMCNVYGVEVPNADGRAGMAAITLKEGVSELDLEAFSAHVIDGMPAYARPVFLRILPEMDTTGTFKMVKGDLRKQAYHFDMVSDKLYVMKPGSTVYEALDSDFIELMDRGEAGF